MTIRVLDPASGRLSYLASVNFASRWRSVQLKGQGWHFGESVVQAVFACLLMNICLIIVCKSRRMLCKTCFHLEDHFIEWLISKPTSEDIRMKCAVLAIFIA